MDPRESVFGECVTTANTFDLGRLAERLLLFERVVLRSQRLSELPTIVEAFGVEAVIHLLNEGVIRFDCCAYGVGDKNRELYAYELTSFQGIDHRAQALRFLKPVLKQIHDARKVQRTKLENAVDRSLAVVPDNFGREALAQTRRDILGDLPSIRAGVVHAASEFVGMNIRPNDFELTFRPDDAGWCADTNLARLLGGKDAEAHRIIRSSLLAVAETEKRCELMRSFGSISDFREREVIMLEEKAQRVWTEDNANAQADRMTRVLHLKGLPDIPAAAAANKIDFKKLLHARASEECTQFRRWLRSIDDVSDADLLQRMSSVRSVLARVADSPVGKVLRLAVTLLPGVLLQEPSLNLAASAAASSIDTFLLGKLLGKAGPLAFLDDTVTTIFHDQS